MRTVTPKNAKLIPENAEQVFKGQIFDVYHWRQEMFDGSTETFEMLKRPDTIKIIAIKDKKIVILEEEQPDHKIDWFVYLFVATDFENQQDQKLDAGERIEVKPLGFKELKRLLNNPKTQHLPKELLESCQNIEDLINTAEYKTS